MGFEGEGDARKARGAGAQAACAGVLRQPMTVRRWSSGQVPSMAWASLASGLWDCSGDQTEAGGSPRVAIVLAGRRAVLSADCEDKLEGLPPLFN